MNPDVNGGSLVSLVRGCITPLFHLLQLVRLVYRWCIMAFRPPTFNLGVNIWRRFPALGAYAAPDVLTIGNLSMGRRVMLPEFNPNFTESVLSRELLLPKLTDIRGPWNGNQVDLVEVPAGSKRFYTVTDVDDVGKGFPNEYRLALVYYNVSGSPAFTDIGAVPAQVPLP